MNAVRGGGIGRGRIEAEGVAEGGTCLAEGMWRG